MRTCSIFNIKLHLIEPLGFVLDDKHLRRSHMDYIDKLDYKIYKNYEEFIKENNNGQFVYFSRYGKKTFPKCTFEKNKNIYLLFGKESTGIPKSILKNHLKDTYRIPMRGDARSLNLSNCVAIGAYECLRQIGFSGLSRYEVIKGKDWLLK